MSIRMLNYVSYHIDLMRRLALKISVPVLFIHYNHMWLSESPFTEFFGPRQESETFAVVHPIHSHYLFLNSKFYTPIE